jgi:peptide/nickel transport system ATP-binding protein
MVMWNGSASRLWLVFVAHDVSVMRYTEALLSAVPIPDPTADQKHIRLSGNVPSVLDPPEGCRFRTRCPRKLGQICESKAPPERLAGDGHGIFCHIPLEELRKMNAVVTVHEDAQGSLV